jgi:small subunit ribosomal protein S20
MMANTRSAKKAARQALRRTEVNKAHKSRLRTFVRAAEAALVAGNKKGAEEAVKAAVPVLMKTAKTGVIHKNTVSRKISRLTRSLKKLQG